MRASRRLRPRSRRRRMWITFALGSGLDSRLSSRIVPVAGVPQSERKASGLKALPQKLPKARMTFVEGPSAPTLCGRAFRPDAFRSGRNELSKAPLNAARSPETSN
ncbi:hypothetical protein [Lysobacter gummosus]